MLTPQKYLSLQQKLKKPLRNHESGPIVEVSEDATNQLKMMDVGVS